MVAVPVLVSGGMAIAAGIGGATLTGIVGGVTTIAGVWTGLFASAEIQQASGNGNWMLDAGMSEDWYNGLMLTVASIATLGTFALSFCYSFNIKSLDKIGRLVPSNHPDKGYWGVRFKNARGALRSVNSESCPSWIAFPAQFLESNAYVSKYNKEMDMVFNKNIEKSQIEEFESECLNKVLSSSMFTFLKKQLIKKNTILR